MNYGNFKSILNQSEQKTNIIFGTGSIPIDIKVAQLATFANSDTKQQGYQVAEVNKLISTMLTGWDANGNKPKSMSDNYVELILSCDNGFVVKKRLQFPHIIAWQDVNTPYNIANVYKPFTIDNWFKADDFENPDITLAVEPVDEILMTTSSETPSTQATTEQSGRFYLYYRNLPVGVNRVHIDFHIKTKTEPIDFDLEVIDGMPVNTLVSTTSGKYYRNILLSSINDIYKFTGMDGNLEDITMYDWQGLYHFTIAYIPTNKITHDLFFYPYV